MNILTKLNQAMQAEEETQCHTQNIVSLQGHIKRIECRSLPSFVIYSSRKVRSQLNG